MSEPAAQDAEVVFLDDPRAASLDLVGGKGANLGKLAAAGFPVPPAFTVTTAGYSLFLAAARLDASINEHLDKIDYDSVESLEAETAAIRKLITGAGVPASLQQAISDAYRTLGANSYVAVRSSGTAEDLEGASFAGLHDTYLDVRGADTVVDAVKMCWASLWSARATGYRHRNGFDHFEVRLAVVVETMVESQLSGVMFTGNPRNAATDEVVINASYGLGEAIVQGICTPDEYVVKSGRLRIGDEVVNGSRQVLERMIGAKQKQIVRNPVDGIGVITEDVDPARQRRQAMTDEQICDLARIGRKIQEHYDGFPQDIEWSMLDDAFYVLQSRPITGINFAWDADINNGHHVTSFKYPPQDPFVLRTRAMADEIWTGAITPLMYSLRGNIGQTTIWEALVRFGRSDLLKHIPFYYHKGYVYWDCEFEKKFICQSSISISRPMALARMPESWHKEALAEADYSIWDYVRQMTRAWALKPSVGPFGWFKQMDVWFHERIEEADGLPAAELSKLTDDELEAYLEQQEDVEQRYNEDLCFPGIMVYSRDSMAALMAIIERWYTGNNANVFVQLVTGTPETTATIREHIALADMATAIRQRPAVMAAFQECQDGAFFERLRSVEGGPEVQALIDRFLEFSGHRGHADRDLCFPRYADDPAILYAALDAHVKSDDDPRAMEERNAELRNAGYAEVVDNLRMQSLGFAKVEAFKFIHGYVMKWLMLRDNERHYIDRIVYSERKGFLEVARRLLERGLIKDEREVWFLTWDELFLLLRGRANMKLTRWKIEGRMHNWDQWDQKKVVMPKYLRRDVEANFDGEGASESYDPEGRLVLRGFGTSGGEVTGTARIVKSLSEIGRVNKGEILIANSTDPGWTPVFAAISGVVVETGGLLSHSGALAREHGFPAAHIENALAKIPDGATITLNGEAGWVRIEQTAEADDEPAYLVGSPA